MEFVTNGTSDMCVFGLGLNFEELTQKIKKENTPSMKSAEFRL